MVYSLYELIENLCYWKLAAFFISNGVERRCISNCSYQNLPIIMNLHTAYGNWAINLRTRRFSLFQRKVGLNLALKKLALIFYRFFLAKNEIIYFFIVDVLICFNQLFFCCCCSILWIYLKAVAQKNHPFLPSHVILQNFSCFRLYKCLIEKLSFSNTVTTI